MKLGRGSNDWITESQRNTFPGLLSTSEPALVAVISEFALLAWTGGVSALLHCYGYSMALGYHLCQQRKHKEGVKADETQASSVASMLLSWLFICQSLLPHLFRMQARWLYDVFLCFLPVKDWIAYQKHMWSYLETDLYWGNQITLKPWGWALSNRVYVLIWRGDSTLDIGRGLTMWRHKERMPFVSKWAGTECRGRFILLLIREGFKSLPCFTLMNYMLGRG